MTHVSAADAGSFNKKRIVITVMTHDWSHVSAADAWRGRLQRHAS
jgi:hypothetical protein